MSLENQTAVVTGSSRGIGRAIAFALAEAGANVLINYKSSHKAAEEVVKVIQTRGGVADLFQADVSNPQQVQQLGTFARKRFGSIEVLVNNAGQIVRPGGWRELTGDDLNYTIDLNLKAAIYCIQEFAPWMQNARRGSIINIVSTYGMTGAAAVLAYTAAKAAMICVTRSMARELGPQKVTVNAIAPGNIETDMSEAAGAEFRQWVIGTTPLGRLGRPDEIGQAAVFLAQSDFITGHILVVDGGQLLNM